MTGHQKPSFSKRIPDDDTHERSVCDTCGYIEYQNPKIVAGSVVRHEGKFLLCRRAIEPRKGYWTLPAGYMELNETPQEGAMREAMEEANADLLLGDLLAVYSVKRLSQVQLIFRATLKSPEFFAGVESLEVELFKWDDIPWKDIAFPTVHWALHHDRQVEEGKAKGPFSNPADGNTDI